MRAPKAPGRRTSPLRVPGLTDRSERPTSHALFAPMEREKQHEEAVLRKCLGRQARRRRKAP